MSSFPLPALHTTVRMRARAREQGTLREVLNARRRQRSVTAQALGGGAPLPRARPAPRAEPEHARALGRSRPRGSHGPVRGNALGGLLRSVEGQWGGVGPGLR